MKRANDRLSSALADRYQIESELGAGGMATVYLAEDLKHDRKVAIKVLRPELAAVLGADRFVQEIKTTASLQHPHILPLHDSGEADGFLFYVMPFIEGETLRDKLDRETQLGIDEAVRITTEVADALEYAHQQGVIHRDIKPENILLHNGRPLVADFGIALAVSAAAGGRMTETGMSLGTPHYMSPEQATADKDITARSDIYSLGSVLYELLTGEPPLTGGSAQQIIMRIVTEEPAPVTRARKAVPPNVAAAVATSLEKLPADRFASASAFAGALADDAYTVHGRRASAAAQPGAPRTGTVIMVLGWAAAAAFAGLWLSSAAERPALRPVTRFTIPVESGYVMTGGVYPELAISPDGRAVAYYTAEQIFLRRLDRGSAEPLEGTFRGGGAFFSPDGDHIAFSRSGLKRVPVAGGPVAEVPGAVVGFGAAWAPDRSIIFGLGVIQRVADVGGSPDTLTALEGGESAHQWPHISADGRLLVFTAVGPGGMWVDAKVVVQRVASGERLHEVPQVTDGRYVDGFLTYATASGTVYALPFDADRGVPIGPAFAVASGVMVGLYGGAASFTVSPSGTAALVRGSNAENHLLLSVDRRGRGAVVGRAVTVEFPAYAPGGRRVAFGHAEPGRVDIAVRNMETGTDDIVTLGEGVHETPVWSPDGRRLAYAARSAAGMTIYVQEIGAADEPRALATRPHHTHVTSWSPDGEWLAVHDVFPEPGRRLFAIRVDDPDSVVALSHDTTPTARVPVFAPDGRWVAFEEAGEVVIAPFPATGGRQRVSRSGGRSPRWAASGELFYWQGDSLMATVVATGDRVGFDAPRVLFVLPEAELTFGGYDVAPNGQRFVVKVPNPDARALEIEVVVNWLEEVRAMAGAR